MNLVYGVATSEHAHLGHCCNAYMMSNARTDMFVGNITWVPAASGLACEVRLYGHLFTVPNPDEEWEAQVRCSHFNPLSYFRLPVAES
jgi:hypothetical protein